jgi:hypothetical protein
MTAIKVDLSLINAMIIPAITPATIKTDQLQFPVTRAAVTVPSP